MISAQEIIRKKRDANELNSEEIQFFVNSLTNGIFSDVQIASISMAILLNGMSNKETSILTKAMISSGEVLEWKNIVDSDLVCDKHSTGGVGDKISLILAPILAACGMYVPMISGRGLGHTGGTLDKFESIPGYNTQPEISKFQNVVKKVGCAIIGQTSNLAPADKKLYSIRDIAGTVESIPLITSSILSKKISAGLNSLILDVKVGNGSFNPTKEIANKLAKSLVNVSKKLGLKCRAILTDMNQILGYSAGHSLEIIESIEYLTGVKKNIKLELITNKLSAELLCLNDKKLNMNSATKKIKRTLGSGQAAEKFEKMVAELGGPKNILANHKKILPNSKHIKEIFCEKKGYIKSILTRDLGMLLIELGGGRKRISDSIDYSVGYSNVISVGDKVDKRTPLLKIHAKEEDIIKIQKRIIDCFIVSHEITKPLKNIYNTIY